VLRTALLFVRSAVRLVYAELPGPVAVLLLKQAAASWVIVSLGRNRIVEHRRVQRAPPPPPLTTPPPRPSTLMLLYAQRLIRIAALKTTAIVTPQELRISLGAEPIPVPEPFAGIPRFRLHSRPSLRITRDKAG
jgi:hypothetical protein